MITIADLFCGAGGSGLGASVVPGVQLRYAANHWRQAVETHAANFPDTDHDIADISQVDPRRTPRTDILWASPECFTAGHLVTTSRGQVPIEDVQVGDLVLTHLRRWRPVVRTQHRAAPTVVVKGQGHTGIETTASHRFWLRASGQRWQPEIRRSRREYETPDWLEVGHAAEREALWATPTAAAPLPMLEPPALFGLDLTAAWWLVGRWVGDGSLSFGRNHEVLLACGFDEADALRERLADTGATWGESRKRTAVIFYLGDAKARDWLAEHFGHGAANKQLPSWALSLPRASRRALLDGYLSADGGFTQRRVRCSTVSRALAVSVRMLAESLGHRVAMAHDRRTTYRIEGREGVARLQWTLHWEPQLATRRAPEAFESDGMAWSRVRSVQPGRESATVYNIEVAEDHSYVLDGIVVSNCTNHSVAKGRKRPDAQPDLFGETLPDEAAERSRATMWDVPRFAEHHRYRAVIVENVVDVARWVMWPAWLQAMTLLGYQHRVVFLNSMHAPAIAAPRAPQSRDRLYVVFWRDGQRAPDLDVRPLAWCGSCDREVAAIQSWKRPDREPWGRYRAQYVYRCPNVNCRHAVVEPYADPAATAIDWSLRGQRIGDRDRPLSAKTLARIRAGLERYARPLTFEARGNPFVRTGPDGHPVYARAWPVDQPTATLTTSETRALVVPVEGREGKTAAPVTTPLRTQSTRAETALLVPAGGTWHDHAASAGEPFRARTTRETEALVVPYYGTGVARPADRELPTMGTVDTAGLAFIAELRGGGSDHRPVTEPLATVTASGNHHMLVRHNTARGNPAQMCTPATEPVRTLTTTGHQSLVGWPDDVPDVEDCTFRMLEPSEIQAAMAFRRDYRILGTRREQVRQLGNGVTPPAAEWLIRAVVDSLGGAA